MKGKNVLQLNQETMCEALQLWFDKNFSGAGGQKVTKVERSSGGMSSNDEFEVTVEEQPAG